MRSLICSLVIPISLLGTIVRTAEIGKPHSTVIILKEKNFDDHLNDPANGLWLLKFYAPWCGHCKKLEPVLDAVAPFLAGKMSIGKVDCTSEKKLCKRFDVKGYPTIKYFRDGDYQDYPLMRDKDSIITFGEKMSERAVKIVSTNEEAKEELLKKTPVAFIVYDPNASASATTDSDGEDSSSSSTIDASGASDAEKAVEKMIQSTERTRVFGQVARKMQAQGTFGLLSSEAAPDEIAKFFEGDAAAVPSGGFIARIEEDVPIKIYEGETDTIAFTEFAKENNLAVVMELGGHNFRFVSRRGKPLAVAVYDPDDEVKTNKFRRELKQYAINGKHKDDYIFSTMDGKKWDKFVSQFSIHKESLPEVFVIDVPERTYWQNASVVGISDFITAVKNGDIESREQEQRKTSPLDEFLQVFVDYMPWSLVAMFALFITVIWLAWPWLGGGIVYPPPPPPAMVPNDGSKNKDQ
mmetsp:Transcript_35325/g.63639  ORF Transcript_35325/g.63639 Transcript_35325/m.63639 type:complete len:466 (+) Transcript_35325:259-1656(+)